MARVFDVDMGTFKITESRLPDELLIYGGRGLTTKLLCENVDPKTDPLGPGNMLIFSTMVLAGTTAPSAGRLSVGFKSPLTGTIKEANAGGMLGYLIGQHDVRAIIIRNKPQAPGWWILHLGADGSMSFKNADKYTGMNNYELQTSLRKDFGENIATGTIGLAGERLYGCASIATTEYLTNFPCRAAARGGAGAVMGSRGLKAILVEKPATPFKYPYADRELFNKTLKKHYSIHENHPLMGVRFVGTSGSTSKKALDGTLPVRNFSGELLTADEVARIEPEAIRENIMEPGGKTAQRCMPGCIGMCSNEVNGKNRKFLTGSLEYETVSQCGPNCGITDFYLIAEIDRFCDDIGIDTIEFGTSVAVAMDSGLIPWGDGDAVRQIMEQMLQGTGTGGAMGLGTERFGRSIGASRIPSVKGQAVSGYEPRINKGIGVTYATSAMGADHTAGMVLGGQGGDPFTKDLKPYYSMLNQLDSVMQDYHMCTFNWGSASTDMSIITDYTKGALGIDVPFKKLKELGVETLLAEDDFNKRAGFTPEDDNLPEFFRTEPAMPNGTVFDFTPEELQMAKQYMDLLDDTITP